MDGGVKILRNVRALATNAGYPWHIPFLSPGRAYSPNGVELHTLVFLTEVVCLMGLTAERHTKSTNIPTYNYLNMERLPERAEIGDRFWVLLSLEPGVKGWK